MSRSSLRVGRCRGNEVVEIEGVNAEHPAQMGAAGLQQRHPFAAVADRIEMRLHVNTWLSASATANSLARIGSTDMRRRSRNPADHTSVIKLNRRHARN